MSNKQAQRLARLARYERSQQTVADSCAAEGVSVSSFHLCKQRLANTATPLQLFGRVNLAGIKGNLICRGNPGGREFRLRQEGIHDLAFRTQHICIR